MREYTIEYKLKGKGSLTFTANSAEEAEEEFGRIMCGDSPEIEANKWIDQTTIFNLEWYDEILDVTEKQRGSGYHVKVILAFVLFN